MCFSASASYMSAALLIPAGVYSLSQARRVGTGYRMLGVIPLFFGIQQALEGRVWQLLDANDAGGAHAWALGFHFFSHFLWLWWIPLSSYLLEPGPIRRRIFLGVGVFGFLAGGTVYLSLLMNPDWLSVSVRQHAIDYSISSSYRVDIGIPSSALYGLIILIPLLGSSYGRLRGFGVLIAVSVLVCSVYYAYAFVSVWCFFAALISIYLVYVIRRLASPAGYSRSLA